MPTSLKYTPKVLVSAGKFLREECFFPDCTAVALGLAKKLIAEGKTPQIVQYEGNKFLRPKKYNGEIQWDFHDVCCSDEKVFDPMLGLEVSVEDYSNEAFGEIFSRTIIITNEELRARFKK